MNAGMTPHVIGGHGGGSITGKAGNLIGRAGALRKWARDRGFDLALSHNSYAQIAAAAALGIKAVTLMDYEHQPANHLAFRLASRVIVPRAFPAAELKKYGASTRKVKRYEGTKEDVYLADFVPDPEFAETLRGLGVASEDVLVVARPPAREALYHRFENELFDELLMQFECSRRSKDHFVATFGCATCRLRNPQVGQPDHAAGSPRWREPDRRGRSCGQRRRDDESRSSRAGRAGC